MKIVLDTNILISALIKDSITRKIVIDSKWDFYYPETSLHELRDHINLILEKSGMTEQEYFEVLDKLLSYIKLVSNEQLSVYLDEANKDLGQKDPDDVVFLAAGMSLENSLIWSNDNDFDKQNKVRVLKTKNILELFLH